MKIISLNIGKKTLIEYNGKIEETGIFKVPVSEPIYLGKEDVVDDVVVDRRYHGGIDKAVYFFGSNSYPFWKKEFPEADFSYGAFGENITVEGLDETKIHIGAQYTVGDAIIEISQPRQPCFKLGIRLGTQKVLKTFMNNQYSGVYARVLQPGQVMLGDELVLHKETSFDVTVAEVHSLLSAKNNNLDVALKATNSTKLANSYKVDIKRKFKIT